MKTIYVKKSDLRCLQEWPIPAEDDLENWYQVEIPDDLNYAGAEYNPETQLLNKLPGSAARKLSKVAFRARFTAAEQVAIYTAAKTDVVVQIMLDDVAAVRDSVDLDYPQLGDGLQYLVSLGILTPERKEQMLANAIPAEL
jgi:hypothetical protein